MDNKTKEDEAIDLIKKYEMKRRNLKSDKSIKRMQKNSGYDLESGDRKIEIKATSQSDFNKGLRLNSEDEINKIANLYIYRVLNVLSENPKLYIVKGSEGKVGKKQLSAGFSVPKDKRGKPIDL